MKTRDTSSSETLLTMTLAPTDFGLALIAMSGRSVKALLLGDSEKELVRNLHDRFPDALFKRVEPSAQTDKIARPVNHPEQTADVPLAPDGTDFQKQVWDELRAIPAGKTVTYGEIAKRIGRPKAVRPVGTACGANPIAVLIPCHRVINLGGGLAGYRFMMREALCLTK